MVDYFTSVSYNPAKRYDTFTPGYRDDSGCYTVHQTVVDSPLDLRLRSPERVEPETSQQTDCLSQNALPAGGELGNVLIVSDLDCDIAQEEVIETAVEYCGDLVEDTTDSNIEESTFDPEEEFAAVSARNAFLQTTCDKLSAKVAKIRQLLDTAVQRQKKDVEHEPEGEARSDSELQGPDQVHNKRSRNNSWPQMSTITSNQRKKEQNKLASKRFRERKKMELAQARQDISELELRNNMLRSKAESMQTEAENLKKILLELRLIRVVDLPTGQSTIVKNI